jgi:ATP-dependent RNA helicase DDX21
VEFFVGTTGRVLDHLSRNTLDFASLRTVVLDEADQMLQLGFKEDVEKIMGGIMATLSERPQVLLFSATVPSWVRKVAS